MKHHKTQRLSPPVSFPQLPPELKRSTLRRRRTCLFPWQGPISSTVCTSQTPDAREILPCRSNFRCSVRLEYLHVDPWNHGQQQSNPRHTGTSPALSASFPLVLSPTTQPPSTPKPQPPTTAPKVRYPRSRPVCISIHQSRHPGTIIGRKRFRTVPT